MSRSIDEVQQVFLAFIGIFHLDGMALDGNATLALQFHIIQHLSLRHLDGLGILQEAVGQGTLTVVNVGYDAEVSYMVHRLISSLACKDNEKFRYPHQMAHLFYIIFHFFFEEAVKDRSHLSRFGYQRTQFVKSPFVLRTLYPQADIAMCGVFLVHVLHEALPLPFCVQLGIVGQSKLDGAPDDCLRTDIPVCFGHYLAIETPWSTRGRSAMVLYSFLHHTQLFRGKPLFQSGVLHQYLPAGQVVNSPGTLQSQVMIGSHHIGHI